MKALETAWAFLSDVCGRLVWVTWKQAGDSREASVTSIIRCFVESRGRAHLDQRPAAGDAGRATHARRRQQPGGERIADGAARDLQHRSAPASQPLADDLHPSQQD